MENDSAVLSFIDKMTYYICHLLDTESNQLEKYSWYLSCCVHFIAVFAPFISLGIEDKSHHIVQILCMYSIIISIFTIYCTISEKYFDTILDGIIFRSSRLQKQLDLHKPYLIIYLTDFGSAGTDEPSECHTSIYSGTVLYSSPNRIKRNSELKVENLSSAGIGYVMVYYHQFMEAFLPFLHKERSFWIHKNAFRDFAPVAQIF